MVRHPLVLSLVVAALVAGCVTPTGTNGKTPPKTPIATKKPGTPVVDPSGLVNGGGNLISDKGLGLIANNGGGLIGKVKIPTGLVSNNSGSLIANNGGGIIANNSGGLISDKGLGLRVLAVDEKPLVGFTVTIVDAEGRAIPDAAGKPYQAVTDAQGNYTFEKTPRGLNLLVKVDLPEAVGPMFAYLPDAAAGAARQTAVDGVSTLVVGYILDRYVKGSLETLQKLPAPAEADTRAKATAALGDDFPLPNFKPAEVVKSVDALRAKDQGFDAQVKYVESLLAAGLKDAGDGLAATKVALTYPTGLARLKDGSLLIAERNGYRVRRIWPNGTITTFAGKDGAKALGDGGPAGEAFIDRPYQVAVDAKENVYVSDFGHQRLRKIDAATGVITTVAGVGWTTGVGYRTLLTQSPALETDLGNPRSLAIDAQDRPVFRGSQGLFRLEPDGKLTLFARGDDNPPQILCAGPDGQVYAYHYDTGEVFTVGENALTPLPNFKAVPANDERAGLDVGADGSVYITRFEKVFRHHGGTVTELPKAANVNTLAMPFVDGDALYLLEPEGGRLWKTPLAGGAFSLVAGLPIERADGVKPEDLALNRPSGLVFDAKGNLLVADGGAAIVWQRRSDGLYYRFAGSIDATGTLDATGDGGPARDARLGKVISLTSRPDGRILIADLQLPATVLRLREIALDGTIASLKMPAVITAPAFCAVEASGSLLISDYLSKAVYRVQGEAAEELIPAGKLDRPSALVPMPDGSFYVCDTDGSAVYHVVGKTVTTVVGGNGDGFSGDGGPALSAKLNRPLGLLADKAGNLYVSDSRNDRIRRWNKATGTIETIAGAGGRTLNGVGVDDSLKEPLGLAFDPDGNLWVTDSAHNQVKVIKAEVLK